MVEMKPSWSEKTILVPSGERSSEIHDPSVVVNFIVRVVMSGNVLFRAAARAELLALLSELVEAAERDRDVRPAREDEVEVEVQLGHPQPQARMADGVAAGGIRMVEGRLIGDDDAFAQSYDGSYFG